MKTSEVQAAASQYLFGNYMRNPVAVVRAQGSRVWDAEGKCYLDLLPGLGVNGLGHCPPRVVSALQRQAQNLLHIHNNYMWEQQALAGKALVEKTTGMGEVKAFFCNSGTEASEGAIKLARLAGAPKKKWKFVSVANGFHGRTYGALSATGQPAFHKNLEPLVPGFTFVPQNDIAALERAMDDETAGFMAEPVQGEGGIYICQREYLEAARKICDRHGALLMYDEVQSGMGRTGDYFAYQTLQAPPPDILWLAKALGGGFPVGAVLAKSAIAAAMVPGTHGTTYGGNPMACAAVLAVVESIDSENVLAHVRQISQVLREKAEALRREHSAKIKEIRQLGLMLGIDLHFSGKKVFARCLELGLMINVTHDTTLRMLPAMNVTAAELDEGFRILSRALSETSA